jgi:predicted patatin/cPLA2 family phospholipase
MRLKRDALADVVKAMGEKKAAQSTAARDVKILIIVLGGAMQGPYGAGQMCALQEMGYTSKNINELDGFLGISAGASTCAFGMAGKKQALLGTSYFYTICASKAFFNYMRIHQVIDVSVIEEALRKEPTKLDVEAVRKNPARFYVQAYNATKGEPEFINAKDPHVDMVDAIHGSMAIPLVYNKAISINGCRYTDGAFDDPLPILRAIREFKPTHILILPNMPFNQVPLGAPSEIKNLLIKAIPHSGSFGFLRKVLSNRQALRQSLEKIAEQNHIKIGVAWPPDMGLGSFTQNVEQIKAAIKASAKDIFYLFGEPKNNLKLYEEEYGNQT